MNAPAHKPAPAVAISSCTLDLVDLKRAVAKIDSVVELRNSIPILRYLRLRADGDRATVTGTDLDMELEIAVKGTGGADMMLPCRTLLKMLRAGDAGDVTIEKDDYGKATIRLGGLTFRVATLPVEDFPAVRPQSDGAVAVTFPEGTLPWLLRFVKPCISTEETRYYLNGAYMTGGGRSVNVVATDGHRLAARTLNLDAAVPTFGAIIPRKTVNLLLGLATGDVEALVWPRVQTGTHEVTLRVGKTETRKSFSSPRARFSGAGWRLDSKMIDGTFPDWRRILPLGNPVEIEIEADGFRRFLTGAAALADPDPFNSVAVGFHVADGEVRLSSRGGDDEASCSVPARMTGYDGREIKFGVSRRYLAAMLDKADDTMRIRFREPGAALECPTAVDGDIRIVMPMRM